MAFIFLRYLTITGEAKTSEVVTMHDGIVDLCLKESWPKIIWKFGFPREKVQMREAERREMILSEMYRLISSIGFAFASSITCFSISFSKSFQNGVYSILSLMLYNKKDIIEINVLVWETQKLVNKQNFAPFFVCLDKFNCFLHFISMFHLVIITIATDHPNFSHCYNMFYRLFCNYLTSNTCIFIFLEWTYPVFRSKIQ